jgi:hypothetical protein
MEKILQPLHSSRSQPTGRRLTAAAITVVLLVLVSACGHRPQYRIPIKKWTPLHHRSGQ